MICSSAFLRQKCENVNLIMIFQVSIHSDLRCLWPEALIDSFITKLDNFVLFCFGQYLFVCFCVQKNVFGFWGPISQQAFCIVSVTVILTDPHHLLVYNTSSVTSITDYRLSYRFLTFAILAARHFLSQKPLRTLWFGFNLCNIKSTLVPLIGHI